MALSDINTFGGEVSRLLESISTSAEKIAYKKKGQRDASNPYVQNPALETTSSTPELSGWNEKFIEPKTSVSLQEYISQHPFKDSAAEKYKHQVYQTEKESQNLLATNTDFSWSRLEYAVSSYNQVQGINTPPKILINVMHEYNRDFRFEV